VGLGLLGLGLELLGLGLGLLGLGLGLLGLGDSACLPCWAAAAASELTPS
jgi:hypothetical protein